MDWEERNPNKKKKKKKGNGYRKEYGCKRKKGVRKERNMYNVLKDKGDITEAEMIKRSNRSVKRKKIMYNVDDDRINKPKKLKVYKNRIINQEIIEKINKKKDQKQI